MSIETRRETITPEKARRYLTKQIKNRPVSDAYVKRLAGAIIAGEWKLNGETIKFNEDDEMEDGQHRCNAVIVADKPIESFVTRGLPRGAFETIDTGRRRSVADVFARNDESHYTTLAGAVTWLWKYNRGVAHYRGGPSPRHAEALALLAEHPGIRECCAMGRRCCSLLPPSLATCLYYLMRQKSADDCEEFFAGLVDGENLAKSNPRTSAIYSLRMRLVKSATDKAVLPGPEIAALVIKAWNLFRARTVVKCLRWRSDGEAPESFPTIE